MNKEIVKIKINNNIGIITIATILLFILIGFSNLHCQEIGKEYYFFYSETLQNKLDLYSDNNDESKWIFREAIVVDGMLRYYTEISEFPYPIETWRYKDNVCIGKGIINGVVAHDQQLYYFSSHFTLNE